MSAISSRIIKLLKWTVIFLGVLILALVIFWKQLLTFILHDLPFSGRNFEQSVWSSALSCKSDSECVEKEMACVRGEMYSDLERNYLIPGTPKEKVLKLLGDPAHKLADGNCIDYELGFCSGLKIDGDFLRVCFSPDEKIERVSHWQS